MTVDERSDAAALPRPAAVTVASWLALVAAALIVADTALSRYEYFSGQDVYEQAVRDGIVTNEGAFAAVGIGFQLLLGAVGLTVGLTLAALALLDRRGRNRARIGTWALGAPILLCYGGLGATMMTLAWTDPAGDRSVLEQRYDAALPSWFHAVGTTTTAAVPLVLLAVLVLLALPTSHRFFTTARGGAAKKAVDGAPISR